MITDVKKKKYEDYLIQFNVKGSLEIANAFYVAYSTGYADACEDSYSESDKSEQILILKQEIEELKAIIKEAIPHVKASLGLIFETDLKHKHMREAKKEYEQWLSDVSKVDL